MTFQAEKKYAYDVITVRFLIKEDEVLQVSDLEGNVLWSQNLAESGAAFRFLPESEQFQIGKLLNADSCFELKLEDSDRRAQLTFLFSENEATATSTFIGIADLRDGRLAHYFNLGLAPLEISTVTESGVRYWVLRSPLEDGNNTPLGYSSGHLMPNI